MANVDGNPGKKVRRPEAVGWMDCRNSLQQKGLDHPQITPIYRADAPLSSPWPQTNPHSEVPGIPSHQAKGNILYLTLSA